MSKIISILFIFPFLSSVEMNSEVGIQESDSGNDTHNQIVDFTQAVSKLLETNERLIQKVAHLEHKVS